MQSRNPVLGKRGTFSRGGHAGFDVPTDRQLHEMYSAPAYSPPRPMTIDDVVLRTAATLGTLVVAAGAAWWLNFPVGIAILALFVGLGLALFISFKHRPSPPLVLLYAVAEGVVLGTISHFFAVAYNGNGSQYGGVVMQAVLGTVLAFVGVLVAYSTRMVRVTPKFVKGVIGAGIALLALMVVNMVSYLFLPEGIGIRGGGALGILFSLAAIVVACLFLVLDFASIESAIKSGAPEREAWMAAFGLTVTLVWLYLEMLRLVSYFSSD